MMDERIFGDSKLRCFTVNKARYKYLFCNELYFYQENDLFNEFVFSLAVQMQIPCYLWR